LDKSNFVNHFEVDEAAQAVIQGAWQGPSTQRSLLVVNDHQVTAEVFSDLVSPEIVDLLKSQLDLNKWLAVGLDGRSDHTYEEIGNYRLSNWNPGLADALWARLAPHFPKEYICNPFNPTDHEGHQIWRPVGVSPLFRYIRYADGGKLVAHYDETFRESDDRRTLESLVIYLTTNERGGTRFIRDEQLGLPIEEYDFTDWDRSANEDEVTARRAPRAGTGLIFPHRLLHDSEPLQPGDPEKIIIRTDIMYERIN
jgi:hypothetical protein